MNWLKRLLGKKPERIKIFTEFGLTTEKARWRAAMNMKEDPAIKQRCLDLLTEKLGSRAKAEAESKRRYPEAWED